MSNQKNFVSLKDWCVENSREDFLELWDYELNDTTPEETPHMSTKKVWLKCSRGLHESSHVVLQSVIKAYKKGKDYKYCAKCNSFGMYVVDNYGKDYLDAIWSDKNTFDPFDIAQRSEKRIWLRCLDDDTHPDYDLATSNFQRSHKCPYCAGKRVCETNSFGYAYPDYVHLWSDKNEKTSYDYTAGSNQKVWWKCPDGIHEDYLRDIAATVAYNFVCPTCGRENQRRLKGEEHPNWKGGVTTEAQALRKSPAYDEWRTKVYEKDNYTCQCCGKHGGRLTAHHIKDYATNEDLRLESDNGMTLCFECHDSTVSGSFHNLYGTHGKTPEELQEYINKKRQSLGIHIPFNLECYRNGEILKSGDVEGVNAFWQSWPFVLNKTPNIATDDISEVGGGFVMMKPKFQV